MLKSCRFISFNRVDRPGLACPVAAASTVSALLPANGPVNAVCGPAATDAPQDELAGVGPPHGTAVFG